MEVEQLNRRIELQDGRKLGYADYGHPDGYPIIYFHGFPSSRLDWQLFNNDDLLAELKVRIIAPDRPGYGLSEFQKRRTILDWPNDVLDLANALEIDRFAVLGISGGGPYTAACGYKFGDRIHSAGIVCGMGPTEAPGMKESGSWSIPGTPGIMRRFTLMLTSMGIQRDPDQFIARSKEIFSEPDRQFMDQPANAEIFLGAMREAFRHGTGGANHEAGLYPRSWGFKLQHIQTNVHLWHGEQDLNVPVSVGRYVAEAIPNCEAKFFDDEGHFTLPCNHVKEIISTLIS